MSTSTQKPQYLISGPDGRELGEGSGSTKAEALLDLHTRAGLGKMVALDASGAALQFSPRAERYTPRHLLVNVSDCTFQELA